MAYQSRSSDTTTDLRSLCLNSMGHIYSTGKRGRRGRSRSLVVVDGLDGMGLGGSRRGHRRGGGQGVEQS